MHSKHTHIQMMGCWYRTNPHHCGHNRDILHQILESEPIRKSNEWIDLLSSKKAKLTLDYKPRKFGVNPKAFVNLMTKMMPDDHIYCADVGQNQIWSAANCDIRDGRFLTSGGMGTMGYSIPAAIGAKLADPAKMVVAVCGDGAFQMQMMELGTICQHDVTVKIVVMTNTKLGMVCEIQKHSYKNNQVGVDLAGSPEVVGIAAAYGIPGRTISRMEEAEDAIAEMMNHQGTFLLECIVDEDEPSL